MPALVQPWPWTSRADAALLYLAFDVGIFYTLGIMFLRYRRGGGPLIALAFLSVLCLVLADTLFLLLAWAPGAERWHIVEAPLYTVQQVLLALGAYRSVQQPPRLPDRAMGMMPLDEWLLWTLVPRALLLGVIAVAISGIATPPRETLAVLLAVSVARELLATYDLRRAQLAQHAAQTHAQVAAEQTERFLSRIIHDAAAPLHGAQSAAARLEGADDSLATLLRAQIEHLGRLFNQLQTYLHARTVPLCLASLDLLPICDAAVDAIQERASARQIQVRLILEASDTSVRADATAVRRVLDNLLLNAITVTPVGGAVALRVGVSCAGKLLAKPPRTSSCQ